MSSSAGGLFAGSVPIVGYSIFAHVQDRVAVWLDVFDPKLVNDEGFQLAQSLFALATGGLFGTGLGQGRPDLIPEAHTDFIFSVIGEELGLVGTAAVLLCFMLLIARGLRIGLAIARRLRAAARRGPDRRSSRFRRSSSWEE